MTRRVIKRNRVFGQKIGFNPTKSGELASMILGKPRFEITRFIYESNQTLASAISLESESLGNTRLENCQNLFSSTQAEKVGNPRKKV
jgi:hypothetical protein